MSLPGGVTEAADARADVKKSRRPSSIPHPLPVQLRPGPNWLAGLYQEVPASPWPPGTTRPVSRLAVLLCNPLGQEAIRCHRTFRVIADRLARIGIPSLRFDYHATGDSAGEDGEGDLHTWQHDIVVADAALRERSGAARVVWLGLRIGACLALDAAELTSHPPCRVILWDPVVKGREYLDELTACHAFWTRQRNVTAEAMGFLLPPALRRQIADIDLPKSLTAAAVPVTILIGANIPGKELLRRHLEAMAPAPRYVVTPQATVWCSNEALGSQLVPTQSMESALREIEELP